MIPSGKNNISLRSVSFWGAVIKAPAVMVGTKSIVWVNGAQGVTILAFTIAGPGGGPCDSIRYGIRVDAGGSADILGNHITDIHDTPFSGCQNGVAILVGRQSEATTGSARILGNLIDNYQKNGPTVGYTGSYAEIAHNRILGVGPTAVIAQNGIQAGGAATAVIRHNFVSGNVYTPQTFASTGILLFQSGQVSTDHNTLTSNDVGVYMFGAAAGSTTAFNRARASTFDGIVLDTVNSSQVDHNKSDQNNGPGIGVYASDNDALQNNFADRNLDSGILLDSSSNNDVDGNGVTNNGTDNSDTTDGIRVTAGSMGNTIRNNRLKNNVTHDCHDYSVGLGTAGTANSWFNNHGETSQPQGLCSGHHAGDGDDNDTFATSSTYGWDPNYAWYLALEDAAAYDWAAGYATIETDAILQLLPGIRIGTARPAISNPYQ